jgi:transmembrane sensor
MNDSTTYYTGLITRYFYREITKDELRMLSDWLKADPENETIFSQFQKTWQLIEKQKIHSTIDTDKEWNTMQAKMNDPVKVIPLNHNRNIQKSYVQNIWKVAAVLIILLGFSGMLYFYLTIPANVVVIAQASNLEQVLPDGSVVSLHAGSQITYPEKFSAKNRNVELEGEAYFKVTHDKTKPFIVASRDAMVKVLGTEFNVNTHATTGTMEVVLTSGKVSVYYKQIPQNKVLLVPGEKAEFVTDRKEIHKTTNTDPNYMAWKTRVLVFNNETMAQVVNTLQNVYQTRVKIADTKLSGCRVTAEFDNQTLNSVLEVLKQTLGFEVKQTGGNIEISGKGCK